MGWILILGLIIWFVVWLNKKDEKEKLAYQIQNIKYDFEYEIRELNTKVNFLENEINKLKGLPEQPEIQEITSACVVEETPTSEIVYEDTVQAINTFESTLETIPEVENFEIKEEKLETAPAKMAFESFVAGNLLNRIGALALILGMGFFLKYAFDQSWINPAIKILMVVLASAVLVVFADKCNKEDTYKIFSQGILGAGLSILYLTIFAASDYYNLINYPTAFVFSFLLTIFAFFKAVKYDSPAVAILVLAGGFITPYILYSGNTNPVALFTYLVFLNGLIIALLYKKESWKFVEITSILATYIMFLSLQGSHFYSDSFAAAGIFLVIIWGMYFALDISRTVRGVNKFTDSRFASNFFNGFFFCASVYSLFDANNHDFRALVMFLIALTYLVSGIYVGKKWETSGKYLKQNVLTSILLTVIATNIAFTGFTKTIFFSLEALGLLWLGIKYQKGYVWKTSTYLFGTATVTLLCNHQTMMYSPIESFMPVLNLRFIAFAVVCGSLIAGTYLLNKLENTDGIKSFFRYSWCTLLFILFSVEVSDFMARLSLGVDSDVARLINFNKSMVWVIIWVWYSLQLIRAGVGKSIKPFIYCGFIGMFIAVSHLLISGCSFVPLERFLPVINLRFIAFLITAGSFMLIAKILKKHEEAYSWSKSVQTFLSYGWCILVFILLNCEISNFFAKQMSYEYSEAINFSKNMILGLVFSLYSLSLIKRGLDKKKLPLLLCGGIGIVFVLLLSLFKGFSFYPVENFIFFFNIRMLMFAVLVATLFLITAWIKKNNDINPTGLKYIKIIQIVLSLLILYILTIETKDLFAKEIYSFQNTYTDFGQVEVLKNLKQLALSGIWLIYSILLMIWGIMKKIKPVRYVSLGILGIAIFKIFVVDLSFLGQLYRIISFIGLGVIMLSASYFYQKYSKQITALLTEEKEVIDG